MLLQPAMVQTLAPVLRTAGPVFFLSLQTSSLKTALGILSDKSTGKLSPIPFVSLLTNCILWTYYGYIRKDLTVLVPNAIGVATGAICAYSYQKYAKETPTRVYLVSAIITAISTYLALIGNWKVLGLIGCALAVSVSGSPLATFKTVLAEKSTAALPFATSCATWLNSASWLAYGTLIAHDIMIWGPNALGLFLATIQMSLFVLFGLPPKKTNPSKAIF